jgi:uncharacterized integral membrane protein
MRALIWSLRLLVFLVFFAFAAKNTEPVTLRFFLGTSWQVPLIVLLFGFFAAGALFGILAMTAPYVRQWREKRRLASNQCPENPPPVMPPLDAER